MSSAPLVKPTLSTAWIATTNSRGSSAELANSTAREASAIARAASAGSLRIARVDSHTDSDRGDPVAMLDLLLGGPGAPVGVSALGFVLIRAAVVANRRYLVGVRVRLPVAGLLPAGLRLRLPGLVLHRGLDLDRYRRGAGAGAVRRGGGRLSADRAAAGARAAARSAQRARGVPRHGAAGRDHVMMRYRKGDNERSSLFTRRALVLGGAQVALMSALVGRLYQLQVLETNRFATLAEENRVACACWRRRIDRSSTHRPAAGDQPWEPRHGRLRPRPRGRAPARPAGSRILNLGDAGKRRELPSCAAAANPQPVVIAGVPAAERWRGWGFNAPDLPGVVLDSASAQLNRRHADPSPHRLSQPLVWDDDLNGRDNPLLSLPTEWLICFIHLCTCCGQRQQRVVAAVQVVVRDAAGIADDVTHQHAFGIVARLAEIDHHARQVRCIELQPRHLFPAEILADHHRLGVAAAAQLAQQPLLLGVAQVQDLVEPVEQELGAAAAVGRGDGAEIVTVDRQRLAGAVEDQATRRRQQAQADPVLLGQRGEAIGLQHLQLVEPADQRRHQRHLRAAQHQRAAREKARALVVALAVAHHDVVSPGCAVPRDASGTLSGSRSARASSGAISG